MVVYIDVCAVLGHVIASTQTFYNLKHTLAPSNWSSENREWTRVVLIAGIWECLDRQPSKTGSTSIQY